MNDHNSLPAGIVPGSAAHREYLLERLRQKRRAREEKSRARRETVPSESQSAAAWQDIAGEAELARWRQKWAQEARAREEEKRARSQALIAEAIRKF